MADIIEKACTEASVYKKAGVVSTGNEDYYYVTAKQFINYKLYVFDPKFSRFNG